MRNAWLETWMDRRLSAPSLKASPGAAAFVCPTSRMGLAYDDEAPLGPVLKRLMRGARRLQPRRAAPAPPPLRPANLRRACPPRHTLAGRLSARHRLTATGPALRPVTRLLDWPLAKAPAALQRPLEPPRTPALPGRDLRRRAPSRPARTSQRRPARCAPPLRPQPPCARAPRPLRRPAARPTHACAPPSSAHAPWRFARPPPRRLG